MARKQGSTKKEDVLKKVKEQLEGTILAYQDTKDDLWLFHHLIPAIKGLEEHAKLSKNKKDVEQFRKYRKAFTMLLKEEKKNFARLSLFLGDETKIKDRRKENMGKQIEEKTDLRKWKGEVCTITDRLDGVTEISFSGLNFEIPSKKVKYLEEVRKWESPF